MPIVLMKKQRLRKTRVHAQGCIVGRWQSWDLNPCLSWDSWILKGFTHRFGLPARVTWLILEISRGGQNLSVLLSLFWGPLEYFSEHWSLLLECPSHHLPFSKNQVRVNSFPGNISQASLESFFGVWTLLMSAVPFFQCSCILFWKYSFWD